MSERKDPYLVYARLTTSDRLDVLQYCRTKHLTIAKFIKIAISYVVTYCIDTTSTPTVNFEDHLSWSLDREWSEQHAVPLFPNHVERPHD